MRLPTRPFSCPHRTPVLARRRWRGSARRPCSSGTPGCASATASTQCPACASCTCTWCPRCGAWAAALAGGQLAPRAGSHGHGTALLGDVEGATTRDPSCCPSPPPPPAPATSRCPAGFRLPRPQEQEALELLHLCLLSRCRLGAGPAAEHRWGGGRAGRHRAAVKRCRGRPPLLPWLVWLVLHMAQFCPTPAPPPAGALHYSLQEKEALLKQDLRCHRCNAVQRTIPALKQHIAACQAAAPGQ